MVGLVTYALNGVMLDELAGDGMLIAVTQDGCGARDRSDEHSSLGVPAVGGCSHHSSGQLARDPLSASIHQKNGGSEQTPDHPGCWAGTGQKMEDVMQSLGQASLPR